MSHGFSMWIQWSQKDQLFLVTIPEFVGRVKMPCTDGRTYEEAARNGQDVIETYVELWQLDGVPLPLPDPIAA